MTEITKNDDGSINITAPVMIPGAKDCDYKNGEPPLTTEQIQKFAKSYEQYQFVDHEHGLTRDGRRIGTPIHSFLLTEDTTLELLDGSLKSYPKGTWMLTSQLTDDKAIQTALDGGYTGYSVSVFTRERADQYLEALKSDKAAPLPSACKTINSGGTSLIKDVPDPVVLSVSLVSRPCLHDSKLCKIDGDLMTDEVKSMKTKILTAMGMSEEAEVEALKSQVSSLEEKIDAMKEEFDTALKGMQESFEATLKEALTPVAEKEEAAEEEAEEVETIETEIAVEEPEQEEEAVAEEVAEETDEEETEEEEVEEPVAEKGESKAEPVHDNISAEKAKPQNIYEALGRNPDGTRKR